MSEKILFRKATPNDAAPVKEIAKSVIRYNYVSFLGIESTNAFIDSGMSDKEIDSGLERCTVMFSSDTIIGFTITDNDLLHLIMIDVPFQGKGYGGKLLAYAEAELFRNFDTIRLQTFKENEDTARFYLKNGWIVVSEEIVKEQDMIMLLFEKTRQSGQVMNTSKLKRVVYPMPDYVEKALLESKQMDCYRARPPYQQNDYIGWITRGKREETRIKRLEQMLSELESGEAYMGMKYNAK